MPLLDDAPIAAQLSQVLVAHTIEVDNEWEHRMRSTERRLPRICSFVNWANHLRFLSPDGATWKEVENHSGLPLDLDAMLRWGYVRAERPPGSRSTNPTRSWILQPTQRCRLACDLAPEVAAEVEHRWAKRYGSALRRLDESLVDICSRLPNRRVPTSLPIVSSRVRGMSTVLPDAESHPRPDGREPEDLSGTLVARLNRVLLELTLDLEDGSELGRPITSNLLRVLDGEPVPRRDLPVLTGLAKPGIDQALTCLSRLGMVAFEPLPSGRGKQVRLTESGAGAHDHALKLIDIVEAEWRDRLGEDTIDEFAGALAGLGAGRPLSGSPLAMALTPPPDGWRGEHPDPEVLPHHPMVLARGGYPDAS